VALVSVHSLEAGEPGVSVTRAEAIIALLALPDEPYLRRGYHYTCPRDQRRDPEVTKRDLGTAYVTWRRQDHADASCVMSLRWRGLYAVRKRA